MATRVSPVSAVASNSGPPPPKTNSSPPPPPPFSGVTIWPHAPRRCARSPTACVACLSWLTPCFDPPHAADEADHRLPFLARPRALAREQRTRAHRERRRRSPRGQPRVRAQSRAHAGNLPRPRRLQLVSAGGTVRLYRPPHRTRRQAQGRHLRPTLAIGPRLALDRLGNHARDRRPAPHRPRCFSPPSRRGPPRQTFPSRRASSGRHLTHFAHGPRAVHERGVQRLLRLHPRRRARIQSAHFE